MLAESVHNQGLDDDTPTEVAEGTLETEENIPEICDYTQRSSECGSVSRSEAADGAVIIGYSEPHQFRTLRRQNNESSIQSLEKLIAADPTINKDALFRESAPSRRPTQLPSATFYH